MQREEDEDLPKEQPIHRMIFGERLVQARTRLKLSQEALAKVIGTTARSINRWEHNQSLPQQHYLERLCQTLQIPPEALFGAPAEKLESAIPALLLQSDLPVPLTPLIGRDR